MALAGITTVGEFHYLHHAPGGTRYDDPNAMGHALVQAARDAGLRITLLDTCYLTGGIGRAARGRRSAGSATATRSAGPGAPRRSRTAYADAADVVVGAAMHSVRGVPVDQLAPVADWAADREAPLHVHLSEQRAENEACRDRHGVTPTALLHDHGVLGPRARAVHATHLTGRRHRAAGHARARRCACAPPPSATWPTASARPVGLRDAGSPVTLGSDSHAVDRPVRGGPRGRARQRLVSEQRGHWSAAALVDAATRAGQVSLGRPDAGTLDTGMVADLVAVRLDSVRTAGGTDAEAVERVVFAATAADVTDVVVSGRRVVAGGQHLLVGDVGPLLQRAVAAVL